MIVDVVASLVDAAVAVVAVEAIAAAVPEKFNLFNYCTVYTTFRFKSKNFGQNSYLGIKVTKNDNLKHIVLYIAFLLIEWYLTYLHRQILQLSIPSKVKNF